MRAFGQGEMQRDRRVGNADLHGNIVVLHQQFDLLDQIVAKQIRPRQRRGIGSRLTDMAKAQAAIHPGKAGRGHLQLGVKCAVAAIRNGPVHDGAKTCAQKLRRLIVQGDNMIHGFRRIIE